MKVTILILALALTGCATCREHPTACAAIVIVATGCISASAFNSSPAREHDIGLQPVNCQNGGCK